MARNMGPKNQNDWGVVRSYEDEIIFRIDTFKLVSGDSIRFKYKIANDKAFTAEVYNNNLDPINPIFIRHDDICNSKKEDAPGGICHKFNRHDEAKEYEEDCDIVRTSHDPNIKSVIPTGMYSQHYTDLGTELKFRIDLSPSQCTKLFHTILVYLCNPKRINYTLES